MRISQLKQLITARYKAGSNRSILIEGSPGIGKTEIPKQAAKELGIGCMIIHAPLMQPEDYGFPVISADRENVSFIVSKDKFPIVGSDCPDQGILVVDELPQTDNNGQKILANMLQAREIHGVKLKDGWVIVATGNRSTDRAGANRILSHLGNRVTRINLDVSLDDWTQWALANNVKPEVIAFIRFRPELLNAFDSQQEINPTPRSWVEGVSADLGVVGSELEFETFKGAVGEGAAAEFTSFLRIYRELPSPDAIMLDPSNHAMANKPVVLYALCGALATRATGDNFGRIMLYVSRMPAEFAVLFVKDAIRRKPEIQSSQSFIQWASTDGAKILT